MPSTSSTCTLCPRWDSSCRAYRADASVRTTPMDVGMAVPLPSATVDLNAAEAVELRRHHHPGGDRDRRGEAAGEDQPAGPQHLLPLGEPEELLRAGWLVFSGGLTAPVPV